ncbi:MAG: antitoxin Xre/MbcA/ParS toxin-binding domain-containing protein [Trueperaceae bacterium]
MDAFRPPTPRPQGILHDLGLVPTPSELIAAVKAGLDVRVFVDLARRLGVSEARLAEVAGIAPTTLTRRKRAGTLTPDEGEHVLRLAALLDRAVQVFEGEADAADWLRTPNIALGGDTPLALADTELGAREVDDLLGRLEHGVYS